MQLEILAEEQHILILNKPAELHSVGEESLEALLQQKFPAATLLQRLDFETSGCLLAVKDANESERYQSLLKNHLLTKTYLLVANQTAVKSKFIRGYIGARYRRSKKVLISETAQARYLFAETHYNLLKTQKDLSLIQANTNFGRRHQVRAMAAKAEFPLCGDKLYGSNKRLPDYCPKFILHAATLSFKCPVTKKELNYQAPNPDYLAKLLTIS